MPIVKTICGMCGGDNCGIDVYVEDDRIVKVRGSQDSPMNQGLLCPQASAAVELTYNSERLDYPQARVGDEWQRISWDEALDTIAGKLQTLKTEHGSHTLAVHLGRALLQFIRDGWAQRFMDLYGTPNLVRNEHMCAFPHAIGEMVTYGWRTNYYGFDGDQTECFLLWASDPSKTHIPLTWREIRRAKKRGAKLIVIDPRRTRPAEMADIHAAPRPGTDLALALGLIHVILGEKLYDAEFCQRWTVGMEALEKRVHPYTPERVAEIAQVPPDAIRAIARMFATTKPAHLDAGNALEHMTNTAHTTRAMMILRAITGNLDVPGGHIFSDKVPLQNLRLKPSAPFAPPLIGADLHPLFAAAGKCVPGDGLARSLVQGEPYPIKAMILAGGNPLLTWPNSTAMARAYEALDFMVVLDIFMTATARKAHLVLPMADAFERSQLIVRPGYFGSDKPTNFVILRKRIKDPGERRSDWWFWRQLAHRMGYGEFFPWETEEQAIDYQLAPLGITVDDLEQNPAGIYVGELHEFRRYEREAFPTPSGKVELYSHLYESFGYDPLPLWEEPAECKRSTPDVAEKYPLILNVGRKDAFYTHSRGRQLPSLRERSPEPLVELHPQTAAQYGIADGVMVEVESPRGRIQAKAWLTDAILPGIVGLNFGWEEANANLLTDHMQVDPVLASPPLRAGLCKVSLLDG